MDLLLGSVFKLSSRSGLWLSCAYLCSVFRLEASSFDGVNGSGVESTWTSQGRYLTWILWKISITRKTSGSGKYDSVTIALSCELVWSY